MRIGWQPSETPSKPWSCFTAVPKGYFRPEDVERIVPSSNGICPVSRSDRCVIVTMVS